ncbi:MAG: hypothetical protein AAFN78_02510 [Pseudomonadota bacterium]
MELLTNVTDNARRLFLVTLLSLGAAACGGGGGGTSTTTAPPVADAPDPTPPVSDCGDCGELILALTDADGDFLSYSVDVRAISLTRAGGAVVNVLPSSARVDFAEYTELAEFFTSATVPNGAYVSGSITLDYTNADVFVEKNGEPVATTITDASGAPLGIQEMTIDLAERDQLVVRRGAPAILVVDFDLNASHTVDLAADPVTAVAEPFLLAEVNPSEVKSLRVRGPLLDVDAEGFTYTIGVRPFQLFDGDFGRVTVNTSETTFIEVDGVAYKGTDGMRVLSAQPQATATLALSEYDVAERTLDALEVYAGSSVPGGELDAAAGIVVAREDNTLTLRGARLIRESAQLDFLDEITVELGVDTRVSKARFADFDGGIDAISVGQRIDVLGTVDDNPPTRGETIVDASAGFARLRVTTLSGEVTQIDGGTVAMNLQSLGGLPVERFDFTGTGSAGEDADPLAYQLDAGALPVDRINIAAPVRAGGFVSPFGLAPPDFEATTLVDFSNSRARLDIEWQGDGSTAPFLAVDGAGIVFDLGSDDLGRRQHLRRGAVRTELAQLEPAPLLVGTAERSGVYAIRQDSSIQLFNNFADFTDELILRLDGDTTARGLHALGGYNDATGEFSAHRIAVRLR